MLTTSLQDLMLDCSSLTGPQYPVKSGYFGPGRARKEPSKIPFSCFSTRLHYLPLLAYLAVIYLPTWCYLFFYICFLMNLPHSYPPSASEAALSP